MTVKFSRAPRYTLPGTVYDAALERIRWLWDEFDGRVAVSFSGGKDSTVVLELALIVARERNALPLRVFWLDQECEFGATVDYVREHVASRPDVDFHWYQIPFRLFNATSHEQTWLNVWGDGEEWVRPKEPGSIHVNDFGTDRFVDLLRLIGDREAPAGAVLTGVRTQESPARRLGLTSYSAYKWVTWGTKAPREHVLFHPIYDWGYRDVWKAIYDGGWPYNVMYDHQYRYGVPVQKMRVSNYHHETAIHALFWLQEIEPETWEAATRRLHGINTAGQIGKDDFFAGDLPYMFKSWVDYRDYLLANLVTDDEQRTSFRKQFDDLDRVLWYDDPEERAKAQTQALIANDVYGTKLNQYFVVKHRTKRDLTAAGWLTPEGERIPR